AVLLYESVGTDYLPELDEGAFILDYLTPPQSTLADTDALIGQIQQVLLTTPEVAAFSRRTGTQLGFFLTESNRGDMSVRLKGDRNRSIDDVVESVRDRILATVPGVNIEFSQMLQDLIGDLSGFRNQSKSKSSAPTRSKSRRLRAALRTSCGRFPGWSTSSMG